MFFLRMVLNIWNSEALAARTRSLVLKQNREDKMRLMGKTLQQWASGSFTMHLHVIWMAWKSEHREERMITQKRAEKVQVLRKTLQQWTNGSTMHLHVIWMAWKSEHREERMLTLKSV